MPRPFLLVTTRDDDVAARGERELFLRLMGLEPERLEHVRAEQAPLPSIDPADYAGILLAGSPYTSTDPVESKSAAQLRVEHEVAELLDRVIAADAPFLGACWGIGTLGLHQGATIDRRFGEQTAAVPITLTPEGEADPLFGRLPRVFDAFVGHKEAVSELPPHAVLLATGAACPVQAFRVGTHQYATQFHPELDATAMLARVALYRTSGYFPADEVDAVAARVAAADVRASHLVLRGFAERYAG
ncbi:glutamine amidotransferase [Homoserinibacter sp. YIM 151385]|uniref:glutamine amidotransferase n=1 Tax=Homoserinibacter sp. YIM 151385 TaxID=2985506 RepID=UPI0022F055F8|nr:glutamine amidotransferase [Homoserinibacter sp. YIM 151385]WBU37053.1 glutamine amidotransferase [Homoserinibacter sp. YIM 151385]